MLSWWLPNKETSFEVLASRHSRVRCEFTNEEDRVFSINNIVLWSRPSNSLAALSSGLWKILVEEALYSVLSPWLVRQERVKNLCLNVTHEGLWRDIFLCLHWSCPLDDDPKELTKAPLMILLISLKTVHVFGFDTGQMFTAFA